jgi:potassium voltage-gated channel Shaker-related subfamily A protein 10
LDWSYSFRVRQNKYSIIQFGFVYLRLEHLQSIIDLRRRKSQDRSSIKTPRKCGNRTDSRIVINVSGVRFETLKSTLERYPTTLLGDAQRRSLFYDKKHDEYFFDRHRICFESILYYYQSHGRIRRSENVPLDTFLEEITFFDLGSDALAQVRNDEDLQEVQKVQLPTNRFYRRLWVNLEYSQYSMTAKIINTLSAIFILLSATGLAIETLPKYRQVYDSQCEQEGDGI